MKISVSLPGEDVEFLDGYARERKLDSRSAALQRAIRLLRAAELGAAYEVAWDDWVREGDSEPWETVISDGLAS